MNYIKVFASVLLFISSTIQAQVANNSFEDWSGETPDYWVTSNSTLIALPVTKSTESHSGNFAAKGEVTTNIIETEIFIPVLQSIPQPTASPIGRVGSMSLYYQFNSIGGDAMTVSVMLYSGENPVGGGGVVIYGSTSNYTLLTVPIDYFENGIPDKSIVTIGAGHEDSEIGGHEGTWFLVDDISFGGVTDLDENQNEFPTEFKLEQNYPNPFNPSTTISFSLSKSQSVSLKIYNSLGEETAIIIDNEFLNAGSYNYTFDAGDMAGGIYIYRLTAGNKTESRKMILIK